MWSGTEAHPDFGGACAASRPGGRTTVHGSCSHMKHAPQFHARRSDRAMKVSRVVSAIITAKFDERSKVPHLPLFPLSHLRARTDELARVPEYCSSGGPSLVGAPCR